MNKKEPQAAIANLGDLEELRQVRRRYSTKNLIEPGDEQLIVEATALF